MTSTSILQLIQAGKTEQEQVLGEFQQTHAAGPDGSNIMQLGVAYLWLYRYEEAYEHFKNAIETFRFKGDVFYGMAGVAKWCLGEKIEAVSLWQTGVKAKYARGGLGVVMPLLLFFASKVEQGTLDNRKCEDFLRACTKDPRIKDWPGPLVKLLLGEIDDQEMEKQCRGRNDMETAGRKWGVEFYRSVQLCDQGQNLVFRAVMKKLADQSHPNWEVDRFLVSRLWSEEFFLARHEAGT